MTWTRLWASTTWLELLLIKVLNPVGCSGAGSLREHNSGRVSGVRKMSDKPRLTGWKCTQIAIPPCNEVLSLLHPWIKRDSRFYTSTVLDTGRKKADVQPEWMRKQWFHGGTFRRNILLCAEARWPNECATLCGSRSQGHQCFFFIPIFWSGLFFSLYKGLQKWE